MAGAAAARRKAARFLERLRRRGAVQPLPPCGADAAAAAEKLAARWSYEPLRDAEGAAAAVTQLLRSHGVCLAGGSV